MTYIRCSRKKSPERWFRKKLQMQGAQKLRSEAHLPVRRNDEVAAQRRRWTFYETIIIYHSVFSATSVAEEFSSIPDGGAVTTWVGAPHAQSIFRMDNDAVGAAHDGCPIFHHVHPVSALPQLFDHFRRKSAFQS